MDLVQNAKFVPTVAVGEVGPEGLVYVDKTTVAPSPSRDYYRLQVSQEFIRMTRWQISHRSAPMIPMETKILLNKFHKDVRMTSEVGRIYGKPMARYISGLSQGHYDTIIRLPLKALVLIMEYVGIRSMEQMAPVCKRFAEVAKGNTLWQAFYKTYAAKRISKIVEEQAEHYGWKTVFLVHGIQEKVFPEKVMRFGLSHPDGMVGGGESSGKRQMSKVLLRQLQQHSTIFPPKPVRPTKSLDDYLREAELETKKEEKEKILYIPSPPRTRRFPGGPNSSTSTRSLEIPKFRKTLNDRRKKF